MGVELFHEDRWAVVRELRVFHVFAEAFKRETYFMPIVLEHAGRLPVSRQWL
jgi:hypothetical protein